MLPAPPMSLSLWHWRIIQGYLSFSSTKQRPSLGPYPQHLLKINPEFQILHYQSLISSLLSPHPITFILLWRTTSISNHKGWIKTLCQHIPKYPDTPKAHCEPVPTLPQWHRLTPTNPEVQTRREPLGSEDLGNPATAFFSTSQSQISWNRD